MLIAFLQPTANCLLLCRKLLIRIKWIDSKAMRLPLKPVLLASPRIYSNSTHYNEQWAGFHYIGICGRNFCLTDQFPDKGNRFWPFNSLHCQISFKVDHEADYSLAFLVIFPTCWEKSCIASLFGMDAISNFQDLMLKFQRMRTFIIRLTTRNGKTCSEDIIEKNELCSVKSIFVQKRYFKRLASRMVNNTAANLRISKAKRKQFRSLCHGTQAQMEHRRLPNKINGTFSHPGNPFYLRPYGL